MEQARLFRLAVEAGSVSFRHVPGSGWTLTVWLRRGDEAPDEVQADTYAGLSTHELLSTIDAVLDREL